MKKPLKLINEFWQAVMHCFIYKIIMNNKKYIYKSEAVQNYIRPTVIYNAGTMCLDNRGKEYKNI